jgi:hypothetical protein
MVIAIEACPMRCCTILGGSSNPPIRPRDVRKSVLQLLGSMHRNAGFLGFALENACV